MNFLFLLIFLFSIPASAEAAELYAFPGDDGATYYTNVPGDNCRKVSLPIKRITPKPSSAPAAKGYEEVISSASRKSDLDPDLIRAVIKAESNFNPQAVSRKGALGLMQLMPLTARDMGVADPFDPEENIHGGARYLYELLRMSGQNLLWALAAYNAGPARVAQKGIPEETRNYVKTVLSHYRKYKGGTTEDTLKMP